ncbi:MAG: hypothetical protein O9284_02055 [Steroidobacteraceae bacterium]|jgi:DNA-binding NarL/FixJ family response regulator|nr:hypothetical protein [Steroidobacteraceae bacterium]
MPPCRTRLRVLLVLDPDPGAELVAALQQHPELECAGHARALEEGLPLALRLQPDVVLLGCLVGKATALGWIARFAAACTSATRILVLSEVSSELLARESLKRGADGFLLHHHDVSALVARIVACAGRHAGTAPASAVTLAAQGVPA